MMHQIYRLKRALETRGKECEFFRLKKNGFREPEGMESLMKCRGLYHEASNYLGVNLAEAGQISAKREPKLLILFADSIQKGNQVSVDGKSFTVTGIDDLGEMHACMDLSLEAV